MGTAVPQRTQRVCHILLVHAVAWKLDLSCFRGVGGGLRDPAGAAYVCLGGPHVFAAVAAFNLDEFRTETELQVV